MCKDHKELTISKEWLNDIGTLQKHVHLATGASVVRIAANKRAYLEGCEPRTTVRQGSSKRTYRIQPSKLISLLREFVADKKPLLNPLHEMDKELRKDFTTAWSSYIENGTISFLEASRPELQSATQQEFGSLYLVLDTVFRVLFRKMEAQMMTQNVSNELREMFKAESWDTHNNQSFNMTVLVLKELHTAEVRCKMTGRYPATPLADIAEREVKAYIDAGAKGVPR